jgi:hypothetical protein
VFFDALRVKIRDEGLFCNKAVHIAPPFGGDPVVGDEAHRPDWSDGEAPDGIPRI